MLFIRQVRSASRRLPPGHLVLLLSVLLTILAACGPGGSGGSAY